jgi:chemotaxis family two-component system sensor kinase Cph1
MEMEATDESCMVLDRDELIRFFSVLSHDLRSPIFSIDGFSELLLADYGDKLDEEGLDFLRRVRGSAQQMKKTLDHMNGMIKLLSKTETPGSVNLNDVIDELSLRFNYLLEEGGVEFKAPSDLPSVRGDREQLREAISALVSNALTFNDRPAGERTVGLEWSREGDQYRFCISDNGIGIDPRYSNQLFDLGLKLDKARGDGPGYGLYLARRVIESNGGTLSIESAPGEGSRFYFTLPAA